MDENDKPTLFHPGVGRKGMTELHYAAYCGDLESLKKCLENGFDPNQRDDYRKYTAVHWLMDMAAVFGPRMQMLKELIKSGADLTLKSVDGETPLSLAKTAASKSGNELAAYLLSIGVKE